MFVFKGLDICTKRPSQYSIYMQYMYGYTVYTIYRIPYPFPVFIFFFRTTWNILFQSKNRKKIYRPASASSTPKYGWKIVATCILFIYYYIVHIYYVYNVLLYSYGNNAFCLWLFKIGIRTKQYTRRLRDEKVVQFRWLMESLLERWQQYFLLHAIDFSRFWHVNECERTCMW